MTKRHSSVDSRGSKNPLCPFVVDTQKLNDRDIIGMMPILDNLGIGVDIYALQLSKPENQMLNSLKPARLGLPYTKILFVDFKELNLASNDKLDVILQNVGPECLLFTKDFNLAVIAKAKLLGVFAIG